jgi:hypothetical protein
MMMGYAFFLPLILQAVNNSRRMCMRSQEFDAAAASGILKTAYRQYILRDVGERPLRINPIAIDVKGRSRSTPYLYRPVRGCI